MFKSVKACKFLSSYVTVIKPLATDFISLKRTKSGEAFLYIRKRFVPRIKKMSAFLNITLLIVF